MHSVVIDGSRADRPEGGSELQARVWAVGLAGFVALSAIGGAIELVGWPRGTGYVPIEVLHGTPFTTFVVPGLLLGLVVGGTSLVATVLAGVRSRGAVYATVIAGGTLTGWIASEVAMMRSIHWLHAIYGIAGVALLALGLWSRWRRQADLRWVFGVTLAEAAGFLAPITVGVLVSATGVGEGAQAAALTAAGMVEGLLLGAGQAWAMPFPVRRLRYAALTAAGAGIAWAGAGVTQVVGSTGAPPVVVATVGGLAGLVALLALGGAQWLELRRYGVQAARWIGWTALAWILALPLSLLPAPLVDASSPAVTVIVLWACAGVAMAHVMALVTWQAARGALRDVRRAEAS